MLRCSDQHPERTSFLIGAVWLLIPWLVFAGGVGFKCWTLTRLIRRQVLSSAWGMERFKAELERTWQRSGSARA